jgi:hypothetical protein
VTGSAGPDGPVREAGDVTFLQLYVGPSDSYSEGPTFLPETKLAGARNLGHRPVGGTFSEA